MRFRWLRRSVLSAACGAMAVVAGFVFPADASATPAAGGQVVVQPAQGNDFTQVSLITSGPCRRGTNIVATVFGDGFGPYGQNVIGNSPTTMFATTNSGGMIIPLVGTMRYFANIPQVPVVLSGPYHFVVYCRTPTGLANLWTFTSRPVTFTASRSGERTYHTLNPAGVHASEAKPPANPHPYGPPTTIAGKAAKGHDTAAALGTHGIGSSGGVSALTIVFSILGAFVIATLAGILLMRRRAGRPFAEPTPARLLTKGEGS